VEAAGKMLALQAGGSMAKGWGDAMRLVDKLKLAARSLFRHRDVEGELDDEMRFHLERQVSENLAAGMSVQQARRAAMIEFGGAESMKEECRETRKSNWVHDFAQDLRYAVRVLGKSPGFAAIAILTLALGIGANTAIFSVVNATLLKPLPFRDPGKLVALWETETSPGSFPLSGEDYLDWKAQNHTFNDMGLYSWPSSSNVAIENETEGAIVIRTEANFFSVLGVSPFIGRTFASGEDQNGGAHVAILSYAFWKAHLAGTRDVLNKKVSLNSEPYQVIGVMPAWYRLPAKADLWAPLDMSKKNLGPRSSHSWRSVGRVKQGVTIEQALADLRTLSEGYEKQFPDSNRNVDAIVVPMRESLVGDFSSQILIMFGAVGLVLLIACANVANLLLARSTSRRQEIAVRSALGAGRWRLVRQMLTESVLLSIIGGALGVVIAFGGVNILAAQLPDTVPQANPLAVDWTALLFAFLTCIAVGVLFGLVPAVQSSSVESSQALRSKGASGASAMRSGRWLRNFLVGGEIALSLALLAGAGLLLRTFEHLRSTNVGVRVDNVLTAAVRLPAKQYKALDDNKQFYDRLIAKLQSSPGVRAVAITSKLPLEGGSNGYIKIPGQQTGDMEGPLVEVSEVSTDYFKTMGIPLIEGRELNADDIAIVEKMTREMSNDKSFEEIKAIASKYVLPAVINQTMAKTFWPGQSAVGKVFEQFSQFRIVGVVGDVKQDGVRRAALSERYVPLIMDMNDAGRPFWVVLQSAGTPESATNTLRSTVQSLDPNLALFHVRPMPQVVAEGMQDTSYETALLGIMAALALILASVGTYGVMSYAVGQRTNEIGIRLALGARPAQIMGLVLSEVSAVVAAGIAVGLVGAVAGAKVMKNLLVDVTPFDAATYAAVSVLLALVALAACYVPVRRAMRVDPVLALRYE
jgi:predicted permease